MKPRENLKICIICSVGGHFKQILELEKTYVKYNHYYVLFYKESIKEFANKNVVFLVTNPERNVLLFIKHLFQSFRIFIKEKPHVIITTGAGVAVATCYIAKLFNKKVVFIEDWCVVERPSFSGQLIYPISDLFIVQRKPLITFYPKAKYGGELF